MRPNRSGLAGERNVAGALRNADVLLREQVIVGRTIYGSELRADFVAVNLAAFPRGLILESKWQDIRGTADEKFPYIVENVRAECYPLPLVVIVHGGGCRPGALDWLRARADGRRLVAVFNLEEMISWALRADKIPNASLFASVR